MSSNEHATRHGRRQDDSLHRETRTLRKMVKTLAAEQHDLQAQMLVLSKMRLTTESNLNKIQDELAIVFQVETRLWLAKKWKAKRENFRCGCN